jgi:hypothetical protein
VADPRYTRTARPFIRQQERIADHVVYLKHLFAGGGAVTVHEVGTSGQDRTRGTGTFGLGLNFTVPQTGLGLFVEGKGWLYEVSNLNGFRTPYDKVQVELGWSGGLSYRFPF